MAKDTGGRAVTAVERRARQYVFDGANATFPLTGAESGGRIGIIHAVLPPGAGSAPHVHAREEEIAYVLKGILRVETEGRIFDLPAGTARMLPRRVPHRLSNASGGETEMLLICTPAGFDDMVRESATFLEERGIQGGRPRPEDMGDFTKITDKYGISVVPEDDL